MLQYNYAINIIFLIFIIFYKSVILKLVISHYYLLGTLNINHNGNTMIEYYIDRVITLHSIHTIHA